MVQMAFPLGSLRVHDFIDCTRLNCCSRDRIDSSDVINSEDFLVGLKFTRHTRTCYHTHFILICETWNKNKSFEENAGYSLMMDYIFVA